MIIDLTIYTKSLLDNQNDIIFFIDVNEPLISKSGVDKMFNDISLIDPISLRYDIVNEPKTHKHSS